MPKRQLPMSPPPSVARFDGDARRVVVILDILPAMYAMAHQEQGSQLGGSGIHVSGGDDSDPTLDVVTGEWQRKRRADCLTAVRWLQEAHRATLNAAAALRGEVVQQPEKVDGRATMTQAEFDRRRQRIRVWRASDGGKP